MAKKTNKAVVGKMKSSNPVAAAMVSDAPSYDPAAPAQVVNPPAGVQSAQGVAVETGNASITPKKEEPKQELPNESLPSVQGVAVPDTSNSQTGGNGNASTNPYSNAFQAYQTNLNKVKDSQIGQLNTEYNNQQKQIDSAYQNLNRNAYVSYMQRALKNRQSVSNMGANRTGMAENMNTANAVDYNRSIGNVGAYRQAQLSNAENAYNSNVANVNNEYATNLANAENQYAQLEIARQNELADLQQQQEWQAEENAKDRAQTAADADRAYQQQIQQFQDQKYADRFQIFTNTVSQYNTTAKVDKAIKNLQKQKSNGKLTGWKKEYYSEMISYLKAQKATLKQKKK